jgi:hypothetical protein
MAQYNDALSMKGQQAERQAKGAQRQGVGFALTQISAHASSLSRTEIDK